jgi:hypothetical protein
VKASNHLRHVAVKTAWAAGGVASVIALCLAAGAVSRLTGLNGGIALVAAVFASCWLIFRDRPARHPAPGRRVAPGRDPEAAVPLALSEGQEPARLAA